MSAPEQDISDIGQLKKDIAPDRTSDGHHSQDGRDMARGTDQPSDISNYDDKAIKFHR